MWVFWLPYQEKPNPMSPQDAWLVADPLPIYAAVVTALAEWAGDFWEEDPTQYELEGPSAAVLKAIGAAGYGIAPHEGWPTKAEWEARGGFSQ